MSRLARSLGPGTWLALGALAYVALAVGLRALTGAALEVDEAEVWLQYSQGYRLGYGPQFPLYYWLQFALFDLFGQSLAALTILRAGFLAASVGFAFLGLRLLLPAGIAVLAALSLALLADFAWVAQYTLTHSRLMVAAAMATFAALIWVLRGGGLAAFLGLGLALGIGGLSKPNFWIVPVMLTLSTLSIPVYRARLLDRRVLLVPLVAALILAVPYFWIATHTDAAMASVHKFALAKPGARVLVTAIGLFDLTKSALYALGPLCLVALLFLSLCRDRPPDEKFAPPEVLTLLWRTALIGVAIAVLIVLIAGGGQFKVHWLLFATPFVCFAIVVPLLARMSQGQRRTWGAFCLAAILGTQSALALSRRAGPDPAALDAERLALMLEERFEAADRVIAADFYFAGNLARVRPHWDIRPLSPPPILARPALILNRAQIAVPQLLQRQLGVPDWTTGGAVAVQTPFVLTTDVGVAFSVMLLDPSE